MSKNSLSDFRGKAGANFVGELSREMSDLWLEKLNLPRPKAVATTLEIFLSEPSVILSQLKSMLFWPTAFSRYDKSLRVRDFNLTAEETIEFIRELPPTIYEQVTIKEDWPDIFGGNLIISPDSLNVYMEVIRGGHSELAHGERLPDFCAWRDGLTGLFHYNGVNDDALRKMIQTTIFAIPSTLAEINEEFSLRNRKFFPGYYEFYWTFAETGKTGSKNWYGEKLRPIFIDYQNGKAFQVNSERINE